jgi:soluble lytic murein transglycosylase-like protein
MAIEHTYLRDERHLLRLAAAVALGVGILALFFFWIVGDRRGPDTIPPERVWAFLEEHAPRAGIDPRFAYAIAWAESGLDARAESPVARGLMQLTEIAWKEVSGEPYRMAWNWQVNLRVGLDYLAFCRDFLRRHGQLSYPLLAAAYRYGPYEVQRRGFNIAALPEPKNRIYQAIFAGDPRPILPPD